MSNQSREFSERQRWMAVLARASCADLETGLTAWGAAPPYRVVKAAEIGTVMVEGRAGGAGRRFNLGEATVTRAVVEVEGGALGFSYALGRDVRKAEIAAVIDALLQDEGQKAGLLTALIDPLDRKQREARDAASRQAAATKVAFFTLVRGDG